MLDLVQRADFRKVLKRKDVQLAIAWQQDYFFKHYRSNRLREQKQDRLEQQAEQEAAAHAMDESCAALS
jgi:hypothetical protein